MMSQIQIGGIHKLNIEEDVLEDPIYWNNQRSKKYFSTLKEIDGQKVLVRTRSVVDSNLFIVSLVDMPQDTFYISKKHLTIESPEEDIPCECELSVIMSRGCTCGAFQKEKLQK